MKRATHIYTLGDYYKTPNLRKECHAVKEGNMVAALDAAYELAPKLPKDGVIIPIPSLTGTSEFFAQLLAHYSNLPIYYTLARENLRNGGLYRMKKSGKAVTEEDTGIFAHGCQPEGRLILVDNVVATGTTVSAAIKAVGRPCEVACIAVDYNKYYGSN